MDSADIIGKVVGTWIVKGDSHSIFTKTQFHNRVEYKRNGLYYREDGPAVEFTNGHKIWYINDKKHRVGDYAETFPNGNKFWFQNGSLHNQFGPAAIYYRYIDSVIIKYEYWLNGIQYDIKSDEEWLIKNIIE